MCVYLCVFLCVTVMRTFHCVDVSVCSKHCVDVMRREVVTRCVVLCCVVLCCAPVSEHSHRCGMLPTFRYRADVRTCNFMILYFYTLGVLWQLDGRLGVFWLPLWVINCTLSFIGAVSTHNSMHCQVRRHCLLHLLLHRLTLCLLCSPFPTSRCSSNAPPTWCFRFCSH